MFWCLHASLFLLLLVVSVFPSVGYLSQHLFSVPVWFAVTTPVFSSLSLALLLFFKMFHFLVPLSLFTVLLVGLTHCAIFVWVSRYYRHFSLSTPYAVRLSHAHELRFTQQEKTK